MLQQQGSGLNPGSFSRAKGRQGQICYKLLRTLPARPASRLYLVYNLSWGGRPPLFTPPPCTLHNDIGTGII